MTIDIVDDNASDAERLKGLIERYAKESGAQMAIRTFKNGMSFLEHYTADTDVVFLDVEMPIMNGIDVAKKLRETDTGVCIVFVTNHAQFALKGYLVNALDYVIKPISYYGVVDRLKRAAIMLRKRTDKYILINLSVNEAVRVSVNDVSFVEKVSNYLIYHTAKGDYRSRGALKNVEKLLEGKCFSRCISGCLVNLGHVEKITQTSVFVGGKELPLARQRKKEFMTELAEYYGG